MPILAWITFFAILLGIGALIAAALVDARPALPDPRDLG